MRRSFPLVVFAPLIIAEPREERRLALFEDCGASGGTGSAVSEKRGFAGVGESSHAASDSVEAWLGSRFARRVRFPMGRAPPQGAVMAEDGVLPCWRSANPNDETERRIRRAKRAAEGSGYSGAPRPAAGGRKRAFLGAIQKPG